MTKHPNPNQLNPNLPKYWWAHVLIGVVVLAIGAFFFVQWASSDSTGLKGLSAEECNAKGGIMKPVLVEGWTKHYDYNQPLQCVAP